MSASVVNIPNDDYIIKETPGGTITFDTGPVQGNVIFTGNFTVGGQQTVVNSTNLDVQDNIITVNHGETGAGVTLNQSGLQIDRGTETDAQFVFDLTLTLTDQVTDKIITCGFVFKNVANSLSHKGVLITEDPYLGEIIKKNSYDQIYDEHIYLFSLSSIKKLFNFTR